MSRLKFSWTRNLTSDLISLYRGYPFLFDFQHIDYKDRHKRNRTMAEIRRALIHKHALAASQHLTVEDIKIKIHILRTQYFKEYNRLRVARLNGSADAQLRPKLWCFEEMNFLKDKTPPIKPPDLSFDEINAITTIEVDPHHHAIAKTEFDPGNSSDHDESAATGRSLQSSPDHLASLPKPNTWEDPLDLNRGRPEIVYRTTTRKPSSAVLNQTNDSMVDVITAATALLRECTNKEAAVAGDDVRSFCKCIEFEMKKIKSDEIRRKLKKSMFKMVMDGQEEDEEEAASS